MPLVFRFTDSENVLKVWKIDESLQKQETKKPRQLKRVSKNSTGSVGEKIVSEVTPIVYPNSNNVCQEYRQVEPYQNKKLLKAPPVVYEIKIEMVEGNCEVTVSSGQYFYEKLIADIELKCGNKNFSLPCQDLLENFYIIVSRNFKEIGYVKFKIGYVCHKNILTDKV